jgi:hypothetical protein
MMRLSEATQKRPIDNMSLTKQPIYPLVIQHLCMLMVSDTCNQPPENRTLIIPGRQVVAGVAGAWQVEFF